ncbi:MAG: ERCC4 domain-containing protein [Bacteroidota bacterium]
MHLTIDHRESRSGIIQLLENNPEIKYNFKSLESGDYIINDAVIFERKTIPDFLVSLKVGRFFRQCYKVKNRSMPFILIIEGNTSEIFSSGMSREAVQGALIHVSVFLGIPMLRTRNIEESFWVMKNAATQVEKHSANSIIPPVYLPHIKYKNTRYKKIRLQILQNLPGIGQDKARKLLTGFGSVKTVFNSTKEALMQIDGIGNKTANKIIRIVGG